MSPTEPLLQHVSDTARGVAAMRAVESERPDALFKDPLARRLAGPNAERFFSGKRAVARHMDWLVLRVVLVDDIVRRAVKEGVDTVVNLAAGMDTRPYRMAELPASLRWIEVDLPGILDEKERLLASERPVCALERIRLDLSGAGPRRELLERIGRESRRALVLAEGLLVYLLRTEVEGLARELASQPAFRFWGMDLISPGMLQRARGRLREASGGPGIQLHFGPEEGARFFEPYGWRPVEVRSVLHAAVDARRAGFALRLASLLPGARRWYQVCLLERNP